MLKNFLKDQSESKDPKARLAAVEQMDMENADHQLKLEKLALNDTELSVRAAAIKRLTSLTMLADLRQGQDRDVVLAQLENRLADAKRATSSEQKTLLNRGEDELIRLVACHASDETVRADAMELLVKDSTVDQSVLAYVVTHCRFHPTRLSAAKMLTDLPLIDTSMSAIRTKDKIVARVLQEKIAEAREKEQLVESRDNEVAQILSGLENLSGSVWSPEYSGRYTVLNERWLQISPDPSATEQEKFQGLAKLCDATLKSHQKIDDLIGFCQDSVKQQQVLLETLETLDLESLRNQIGDLKKKAVDANGVWRVSHANAEPDAALVTLYETTRDELQEQLKRAAGIVAISRKLSISDESQALSHVPASLEKSTQPAETPLSEPLPAKTSPAKSPPEQTPPVDASVDNSLSEEPATVREAKGASSTLKNLELLVKEYENVLGETLSAAMPESDATGYLADARREYVSLSSQLKQKKNIEEDRIKAAQKQLAALGSTIGSGQWNVANSLYTRIEKKLKQLSGHKLSGSLSEKLSRHKQKLDELADWQDFAARPKLEKLCEQMESLSTEELEPLEVGSRLKALQGEWKSIGPCRVANELWTRFKEAGDAAYVPVSAYNNEKKKERSEKLGKKAATCKEMESFLKTVDWDNADWKLVEKTLRDAKREWTKNRVADRKPDQGIEGRFSKLVARFNEKLNGEYDANAALKTDLVEKAKKISEEHVETQVSQHAINQTRRLQSTWKLTGIMRRNEDQKLWEQFNGYCREIHKKHHVAEREKTDASTGHVREARDLIKAIKQLGRGSEPDEKKFQTLQDQFNALAEFPEKDKRGLIKEFNQATQQFGKQRDAASRNAARAEFTELERRSQLCEQLEALTERDDVTEPEWDAVTSEWDVSGVTLPKEWAKQIDKRRDAALKHLKSGSSFDYKSAETARRMTCIKAEIVTDVDTPAEDKALRMQYQLENLQQGIGAGGLMNPAKELKELRIKWLCLAPASLTVKDKLQSRFAACFKDAR